MPVLTSDAYIFCESIENQNDQHDLEFYGVIIISIVNNSISVLCDRSQQ